MGGPLKVCMVIPSYWARESKDGQRAGDAVYDHPTPIDELQRLYAIHRLTYFRSREEDLVPIGGPLALELQGLLKARGFYSGPEDGRFDAVCIQALHDFMGWENYDERIRGDGRIDSEVLEDMRAKHQRWLEAG